MNHVETEGDTIDKAIENALKVLGVERDKITVDILSEGKKGILGFGFQKARIRATLRQSAVDLGGLELQSPAPEVRPWLAA
jgi:spoIIIJ-associated protein